MNPYVRLPFAPLAAAAAGTRPFHTTGCHCNKANNGWDEGVCYSDYHLARDLGLTTRTVSRYRNRGVPIQLADRLACRIGWHPIGIWGTAWEQWADQQVELALGVSA